MNGSITLARSLPGNGLLDELPLLLFPVIVGSGRRFFDDIGDLDRLPLNFLQAKPLPTGGVSLRYGRSMCTA